MTSLFFLVACHCEYKYTRAIKCAATLSVKGIVCVYAVEEHPLVFIGGTCNPKCGDSCTIYFFVFVIEKNTIAEHIYVIYIYVLTFYILIYRKRI